VEAHVRASNFQREADDCLLQAGRLPRLKAFKNCYSTVSCYSINVTCQCELWSCLITEPCVTSFPAARPGHWGCSVQNKAVLMLMQA